MQITEVRIKLMENSEDRLRGFCSVTFDDCFVIRDLKIIEGNNGPFVAMPSRKLTFNCHKCRTKNHLRARYCNHCGAKQKSDQVMQDSDGRARLYADIAHPVNANCREMIQNRVIEEFEAELKLAAEPGYVSRYDDDYNPTAKSDSHKSNNHKSESRENNESEKSTDDSNSRVDSAHQAVSGSHTEKSSGNTPSPPPTSNLPTGESESSFGKGILD